MYIVYNYLLLELLVGAGIGSGVGFVGATGTSVGVTGTDVGVTGTGVRVT